MLSTTKSKRACLILALMAGSCFAQGENAKPAVTEASKSFLFEFVLKELEGGKVINSRAYSMVLSTEANPSASIRTGTRVPVPSSPGSAHFQYTDVGVNIDCRGTKPVPGGLALTVNAEISSIAPDSPGPAPMVRQTRWSSNLMVPVGRPVVLFSSDDVTTKRQLQLGLTVRPAI
jgi:hypothetical protein